MSHFRSLWARTQLLRRDQSGQAMLEYSMVVYALFISGTVSFVTFLPHFLDALNLYLNNLYFFIDAPLP